MLRWVLAGSELAEAPPKLKRPFHLEVTIDHRDVIFEILSKRLGNPDWRSVFLDDELEPQDRGVLRT